MKKKFGVTALLALSTLLLPVGALAESQPLYKFGKKADGTLGYDTATPVPFYANSSDFITIPTLYEQPKNQFKSSWVATISNLNFPKATSQANFQENYLKILNDFSDWNMNAMMFQVRPLLDAYYPSELNPWSEFITGQQGTDPGYDPLKWMVDATHQAGMEYHAWFNPYRVSNTKLSSDSILKKTGLTKEEILALSTAEQVKALGKAGILASNNYALLHPENVLSFDEKLFLNPGIPAVRDYVVSSIAEVVHNYDVDAIHFDDYFYPYRITVDGVNVIFGDKGEDADTFQQYGAGYTDIEAWRRDNITALVDGLKTVIDTHNQTNKKAVQFGISPFGIWEHKANNPLGSNTPTGSSQSYSSSIYADTYKWMKEESLDYVIPQIYWSFDQAAAPYGELTRWWNNAAEGSHTQVYVGHANYKHVSNGGWDASWLNPEEVPNQLKFNQNYANIKGSALFSYNDIQPSDINSLAENLKERHQAKNASIELLKEGYFNLPTLVPEKPWLSHETLTAPVAISKDAITLKWSDATANETTRYYVLYSGEGSAAETTKSADNIVDRIWAGTDKTHTYPLPTTRTTDKNYYVTAVDAAGMESEATLIKTPDPLSGSVTVTYMTDTETELAPKIVLDGLVGANYQTENKTFKGYTLKEVPANAEGKFTNAPQRVAYVYTKDTEPSTSESSSTSDTTSSSDTSNSTSSDTSSSTSDSTSSADTSSSSSSSNKGNGSGTTPSSSNKKELDSTAKKGLLPQTGEAVKTSLPYLGLIVLGLTIGLLYKKKRI